LTIFVRSDAGASPGRVASKHARGHNSELDGGGNDIKTSCSSTTQYTFGSPVSGGAGRSLQCLTDDVSGGTLALGSVQGERTKRLGV
jgi:hypothetical protein